MIKFGAENESVCEFCIAVRLLSLPAKRRTKTACKDGKEIRQPKIKTQSGTHTNATHYATKVDVGSDQCLR